MYICIHLKQTNTMINEQNFVEIFHTSKIDAENFYFELTSFFCERKKHKEVLEKLDKLCDEFFMKNIDFVSELKKDFEIQSDKKVFGKTFDSKNYKEKLVITTLTNQFECIKNVENERINFECGGETFIFDENNRIKEIRGMQITGDYVIEHFEWNDENHSVKSYLNTEKNTYVIEYYSPDWKKLIKKEVYLDSKLATTTNF